MPGVVGTCGHSTNGKAEKAYQSFAQGLARRRFPLPHAVAYAVETEPGIQALVYRLFPGPWYARPPRGASRAVLYVAHLSSDAELREEPLMCEPVKQVTLKHALTSYAAVAESEDYAWPLATLLPNVLARFDLPDCYRELQAKRLRQIEPWGPMAGKQP